MISPRQFAAHLARQERQVRPRLAVGLAELGRLAVPLAAELIGHELPSWRPLAQSTIAEKQKLGFTGQVSATDPRLRTGEDRDSIEFTVLGLAMVLGSKREIFMYQELGTSRIPARPVLALAMQGVLPYADDVFGDIAQAMLTPPP
jgi:hypothetical protein